jgi:endonuclease/exonuclease/phosphatase family metal-dependent hydrolase
MRLMKHVICAPWVLVLLGCNLADPQDFDREEVIVFKRSALVSAPDPGSPARLKVLAWNIKYGAGRIPFWFDCWGDRSQMTAKEVEANMAAIYALLDELQPDIVMMEEIEMNSRRSAYYDMIRGVLEHSHLNYGAFFETWDSRYIASEGVGRMQLGNAIFSRWPIKKAERIRQADRTDQDALTAKFYIKRAVGRAEIEVRSGLTITGYVVHHEAYDNDGTKQKQIKQVRELLSAEKLPWVAGGDWNELPPTAVKLQGFMDEREAAVCADDFKQPPYTPKVMQPFYDEFLPHVDLARYGTDEAAQARYYTHSVLGPDEKNDKGVSGDWNRTLDYLFVRKTDAWVPGTTDVAQRKGQELGGKGGKALISDPVRLSDHAPVVGTWEVRP